MVTRGYHSGGAAYVLSREALRRFYQAHHVENSTCLKDGGRGEDVEIADCLRKQNVYPGQSIDRQHRERFHPLNFSTHFQGKFPKWLQKYAENPLRDVSDIHDFLLMTFFIFREMIAAVIQPFHFIMSHRLNSI